MISQSEARAKLSLDTSSLGAAKQAIGSFGREAHEMFGHAAKPARTFHKTLEEITTTSPIAGAAFKMWLNPVVGMLAAAVGIFAAFKDKLTEVNKVMDAVSKANAQSWNDARKVAREVKEELMKERQSFAELVRDITNPINEIEAALKREGDALKRNYEVAKARRDLEKKAVLDAAPAEKKPLIELHYSAEDARAKTKELKEQLAITKQHLSTVDAARKKVAGDIDQYNGKEKIRETRSSNIKKAEGMLTSIDKDLGSQDSVMDQTQGSHEKMERGAEAAKNGKGSLALWLATDMPLPTDIVNASQYDNASRRKQDLMRKKSEIEQKLQKMKEDSNQDTTGIKHLTDDLKELDRMHNQLTGESANTQGEIDQIGKTPLSFTVRGAVPGSGVAKPLTYKPLRGAPGYIAPGALPTAPTPISDSQATANAKALDKLVNAAYGDGLIVKGKDTP